MSPEGPSQSRFVSFVGLLGLAWTTMLITHECGHILGGFACGATLTDFDLAPWRMPYSLHAPDPHPLVTLWCGPVMGALAPLAVAILIRRRWMWFIADFCLLANGGYLSLAWIAGDRMLDTPRMLAEGAHPATIIAYCALTLPLGYARFRADCVHQLKR